jgi:hypothetical protein
MAREKIGEVMGIDLIIDDDVPEGCAILHNAKEAMVIKDGVVSKVDLPEDWARDSRLAGNGRDPYKYNAPK